jgi:hypothetical protein
MVHIPTEYVDMILWILEFRILKNIKALTKYQVEKYGTDVWLRMHLIQTRVKRSVLFTNVLKLVFSNSLFAHKMQRLICRLFSITTLGQYSSFAIFAQYFEKIHIRGHL